VDGVGNVYIADYKNDRIRKVSPDGIIRTIAGNGIQGYSGDGGLATRASLSGPTALAVDGSDNIYVADKGNNAIRILRPVTETAQGESPPDRCARVQARRAYPTSSTKR
jgi:hypothetical protein